MKFFFTNKIVFILSLALGSLTNVAQAKKFYISASGNNANNGLTPATAWQSITKINASFASMATGDSILFKSGETFYGSLAPTVNGITFTSYGNGAKPVITGLTTISSWTSLGNNIWEAVVPGGLSTLNMVIMNGKLTAMGRYPNADAGNSGYLSYESFVNNTSITDMHLTGAPNWTGGDVVIRQSDFVIKRLPITAHSGTKISFTGTTGLNANYGYFVQNHLSTLDQNGEWLYVVSTKKIKMYHTGNPPAIQVATQVNLVSMMFNASARKSNVTFKGLAFKGCEGVIMNIQYCNNFVVDGCDFSFAGTDALDNRNMIDFQVRNSSITDINMNGIHETNPGTGDRITIQNNAFKRIGVYQGMISNNTMYADRQATGINIGSTNLMVRENTFDSTGFAAIDILKERNYQVYRKNIITNFCLTLNDGGGIYNSGLRGDAPPSVNLTIDSNILSKSGNPCAGTNSTYHHVRAIYLDASSTKVNVLNNTIFNVSSGIYISSAQSNIIRGNTVYDAGSFGAGFFSGMIDIADANAGYQHTRYNTITNNIFFAKYPNQLPYYQTNIYNGVDSIGKVDSNYYVNTSSSTRLFTINYGPNNTGSSFPSWRTSYPVYDKFSRATPMATPVLTAANVDNYLRFDYNPTNSPVTITFTGKSFMDAKGTVYNNSVVIPAWGSKVLINNGAVATTNIAPKSNAGSDNVVTLPANTATLTGSATDSDGTISGYAWLKISGPASATIATANAVRTAVTNLSQGVYQFELTVQDNNGAIGKDTVELTVNAAVDTKEPVANAGTDITIKYPANKATLRGAGTKEGGTISSYTWVKIAGPSTGKIAMPDSSTTLINKLVQGIYLYQLTVKDNIGITARDTIMVTVNSYFKQAPVVRAVSNPTITLPINTGTLSTTGADTADTTGSIPWVQMAGPDLGLKNSGNVSTIVISELVKGEHKHESGIPEVDGVAGKDTNKVSISVAARLTINTITTVAKHELKVYPNPVINIANLEIACIEAKKLVVTISDMSGREVKYLELQHLSRTNTVKLDLSSLREGYYVIVVRFDDGQKITSKFMKSGGK